jgi:hypothetical protein
VGVLVVLFMLSRLGRRMDRLAEQTLDLIERAERQFGPTQPPARQS